MRWKCPKIQIIREIFEERLRPAGVSLPRGALSLSPAVPPPPECEVGTARTRSVTWNSWHLRGSPGASGSLSLLSRAFPAWGWLPEPGAEIGMGFREFGIGFSGRSG